MDDSYHMMRKIILGVAVWYFLILSGGPISRKGPFGTRLTCDTSRMRVSHLFKTSDCIEVTPKKQK